MPDYALLDQPVLLDFLFFPRRELRPAPPGSFDFQVPVEAENEIYVHCRFYPGNKEWPWMLYFHGNGEVVSDYDEFSRLYNAQRINLVVADYRGYGGSKGSPTFVHLVEDAHRIFRAVREELSRREFNPELWLMGRSLGSISALELAFHYQQEVRGLVIESGFASLTRLIKGLELPADYRVMEPIEQECLQMLGEIKLPALVIHGEEDNLVYLREGKLVFEQLGSQEKEMLVIPGAGHNDVVIMDLPRYFGAIAGLVHGKGKE